MWPNGMSMAITLAGLSAIVILLAPEAAYAGMGRIFCGLAGAFGNSPTMKIFSTCLIIFLCIQAALGKLTWQGAFFIALPIIILAGGSSLLYALSGENCQPDEPQVEAAPPSGIRGLPTLPPLHNGIPGAGQ
jgi:hypothetical protein